MLYEQHFRAMNTAVGVWAWSEQEAGHVRQSLRWAEDAFVRVEHELSRFSPTSGLSELNRSAGSGAYAVSPLLWSVLDAAMKAADDSDGIYDPTLLKTLERIGYDRSFETLEACADDIETGSCRPTQGSWRRLRLDRATCAVSLPTDLAVDLGGIAKGWTVDFVARVLAPLGPVLVDAGGDLRAIGTVGDEPWPIAVQDPFEPEMDRSRVRLEGGALATSSVGGRRWSRGHRVFHHLVDPRTGTSAESDLHTVTVYAPTAMAADVAAKVALVLGSEAGASYLVRRHLSGLLTDSHGREVVVGHFPHERTSGHASIH
ncbi:MAG: FAD:protein FMN transferase [Vicinamibacterales bacterium]